MPIVVPTISTKDWKRQLRGHDKPWRDGFRIKSLADHWQGAVGFPVDVQQMFKSAGITGIKDAEMLLSVPEYETELLAKGGPSFADLFVLATSSDGLITMMVESRVDEPFDSIFNSLLWKKGDVIDKRTTLTGLSEILGITVGDASVVRYQLLHRTASALIEAERYSATTTVMLVHSFSSEGMWFEDYEAFGAALGVSVESGQLVDAGIRSGRRLMLGWLTSPILSI
ncbi:MAG: hypothetical protein HQ477_04870 [Chloroflexi bacterium]|nr:hypothetical protein [Chloroflexota bacterium]